ncbi:hypothetical protein SUGI_0176350 [Cryptomeria japonica]|nr:hypothetical protein SUGI_0176350 [Cryptomeria japonica]
MAPDLMAASKPSAFLALFLCALLSVVSMAQEEEGQWFWIMADSKNSTATCPGRCLAVNDSGAVDYSDRTVVFVACKDDSTADPTTANNEHQRWLRDAKSNTTIRFNASAASDDPQAGILCLEPNPNSNRTLKLSTCTRRPNQQWIVANDSIKTLASNPPSYLAMGYDLAGFLKASDGLLGWRRATILPSALSLNRSFTATFSMVDGTLENPPPPPALNNETLNFIRNGGFEQSSYDFPNTTATLPLSTSDPFSLCNWQIMKDSATLSPHPGLTESNRSLLLKDAVVRQIVATSPGAFYTLVLKVATAPPDPSDTSNQCSGNDTLSVNPYPSSNLQQDVQVRNQSWTTQHLSFQAGGPTMQLAFQGCTICGCYLGDLNLMQVLGPAPFPPPPPRPSPPAEPTSGNTLENRPPKWGLPGPDHFRDSKRLSNGAVVGIVVGTAALFFGIGGACFWVLVGIKKRETDKDSEIGMGRRPGEWSIQTTTPARSQAGTRGDSSTTVAPTTPSTIAGSSSSLQTAPTSNPLSSSNPHDQRRV